MIQQIKDINLEDYTLEKVHNIFKRKFKGDVYTFEVTKKHRYFANNYLVGNCRCTFDPVISFEPDEPADELQSPIKYVPVKVKVKRSEEVDVPQEFQEDAKKYVQTIPLKKPVRYVPNISTDPSYLNSLKKKLKTSDNKVIEKYILEHSDLTRVELPDVTLISTRKNQTQPISQSLGMESGLEKWRDLDLNQKTLIGNLWVAAQPKTTFKNGIKNITGLGYLSDVAEKNSKFYFADSFSNYVSNPGRLLAYNQDLYDFIKNEVFNGKEFMTRGGIK